MECFVTLMGSWKQHKMYREKKKRKDALGQDIAYTAAEMDVLLSAEGNRFHGFMLNGLQMSGQARNQLFYTTFAATAHGLTKSGMDLMSSYGWTLPHTSFYRARDRLINEVQQKVR